MGNNFGYKKLAEFRKGFIMKSLRKKSEKTWRAFNARQEVDLNKVLEMFYYYLKFARARWARERLKVIARWLEPRAIENKDVAEALAAYRRVR